MTGAAGWLGRGLLHALVHGLPEVSALEIPQEGLKIRAMEIPGADTSWIESLSDRVEVVRGDLRLPEDCGRFCEDSEGAVLFHLAGIIHPRRVREFYEINVKGTRNLLAAAIQAGVRRVIAVSSNSPCGVNPTPEHRFDEESPYNPYMNYGQSKMLMELHLKEIQKEGAIETVIARAMWFYGPFQPQRQTLFFRMIREGKAPIVGSGENVRSMSYIDNLVQGLLLAALKPEASGQVYWLADERPYSMNEIVDTVERLLETEFSLECKHKRFRLPGFASGAAWLLDSVIQAVGLYHQKIHVLSEMNKNIACLVDKAKRELGYSPKVSLEEGMRRSIKWVLDSGQEI